MATQPHAAVMLHHGRTSRRQVLVAALAAAAGAAGAAVPDAPNFIAVSPLLATSGQPTAEALRTLSSHGFQAVVYLAPGDVPNAVRDEAPLLAAQGIAFAHIPIPFGAPQASHVQELFATLERWKDRKTLVHCEINMRASTLVFLYRSVVLKEAPSAAYEAVARVWSPRGVWRKLVTETLVANGIAFEPY